LSCELHHGEPCFPEFLSEQHIAEVKRNNDQPLYAVVTTAENITVAIVVQFFGSRGARVLWDSFYDGTAVGVAVAQIGSELSLEFGPNIKVKIPPRHYGPDQRSGLVQAARSQWREAIGKGGELRVGEQQLRKLLDRNQIVFSPRASLMIKAILGGYSAEQEAIGDAGERLRSGS
jgi:hypothetical protein